MRPLIALLLMTVFSLSQAQNGYQITDTSKQWNTVFGGTVVFAVYDISETRINKIGSQVEMNGQEYFSVLESDDSAQTWYGWGYLREDTMNQQVYYYTPDDGECLLYDFKLNEGDTVTINNPYMNVWDYTMVCDSIDFITVNGGMKKRLFMKGVAREYYSDVWIQGVGSTHGLLCSGMTPPGGHNELLCCSQNGELLYENDRYHSCYEEEAYPDIATDSYDTAYINTYYEFQMEYTNNPYDDPISWDPIALPNGLEINENTGLISGIPTNPGSQACIITIKNDLIGSRTDFIDKDLVVVNSTNTTLNQKQKNITVYPNPADEQIKVEMQNHQDANYVQIYEPSGRMLKQTEIIQNPAKINCSKFSSGIYIVKVLNRENRTIVNRKIAVR
ncbi:MAG: T9SS type A sorting domain-containing protein [Bacteroidales bacterium]|nr:T9SS type A sorting domain-containing protein [Bacteroidales bacterium]MCF8334674.1 T9SS type A sorting domain-containing protein [Bacteroidales bacterium]